MISFSKILRADSISLQTRFEKSLKQATELPPQLAPASDARLVSAESLRRQGASEPAARRAGVRRN